MQLDDNRWMNASAHCSALPDCTLDLHDRAGDIQRKAHIITLLGRKDQDASVATPLASIVMHHIAIVTHRDVQTGTCEMTKLRRKT